MSRVGSEEPSMDRPNSSADDEDLQTGRPDDSGRRVKVAIVQDAPAVFDRERTLDRVEALTRDAAKRGAQLVLFPEAFVSGYPFGATFGAVVGARTADGHELFRRYWASAVDVPGPATDRLGSIAAENDLVLVVGIVEREGGTLYCTVVFLGPDGALLGKHRKLMPTGAERLVGGRATGRRCRCSTHRLGASAL